MIFSSNLLASSNVYFSDLPIIQNQDGKIVGVLFFDSEELPLQVASPQELPQDVENLRSLLRKALIDYVDESTSIIPELDFMSLDSFIEGLREKPAFVVLKGVSNTLEIVLSTINAVQTERIWMDVEKAIIAQVEKLESHWSKGWGNEASEVRFQFDVTFVKKVCETRMFQPSTVFSIRIKVHPDTNQIETNFGRITGFQIVETSDDGSFEFDGDAQIKGQLLQNGKMHFQYYYKRNSYHGNHCPIVDTFEHTSGIIEVDFLNK